VAQACFLPKLLKDHDVLLRRYREGEKLTYHMKGIDEDWHYEIQAEILITISYSPNSARLTPGSSAPSQIS
jgi:hypothetical protein